MLDDASTNFIAELAASGLPPIHELTPEQARAGPVLVRDDRQLAQPQQHGAKYDPGR